MIFPVQFNYYDFYYASYDSAREKLHRLLTSFGVPCDFILNRPVNIEGETDDEYKARVRVWDKELEDFLRNAFLLDVEKVVQSGVCFTVKAIYEPNLQRTVEIQNLRLFAKVSESLEALAARKAEPLEQLVNITFGEGNGTAELMGIKELEVLTDCCTDELRRELEKGWKILAVCPQKNQRRPDYVIGK